MTRQQIIIALAFALLISLLLVLPRRDRGGSTPPFQEKNIIRFVAGVTGQVYDRGAHFSGSPLVQVNSKESLDDRTERR